MERADCNNVIYGLLYKYIRIYNVFGGMNINIHVNVVSLSPLATFYVFVEGANPRALFSFFLIL